MRLLAGLFLLFIGSQTVTSKVTCSWEACNSGKSGMLNVHLVSHSHDDAGWLKTVDQYYTGSNQSQSAGAVQFTYDTVVATLMENPERKFSFCETTFFWRWWNQQHDFVRHQFKNLMFNGQLEVIGGGWVQNDEATTHYTATIDQMTVGLRYLNETFGRCGKPKTAWQIDPFGHSKEQASLFAQMGFDGLFFGRLHYMDKNKRMKDKSMELLWHGSDDLEGNADLFTGVNFNGYNPPPGLCFDEYCGDDPIQDDHRLDGMNTKEKLALFVNFTMKQAKAYPTNNIMLTMGSDFQYTNAQRWYKNLDKLIKLVNEEQDNGLQINAFYSTPTCYMNSVNAALKAKGQKLPTKSDDFFPYASGPDSYWAGYFTSRPSVKGFIRQANNALKVCKQMDAAALLGPEDLGDLDVFIRAMALVQHHDAVTGTERQHVANDYIKRLYAGLVECEQVLNDALLRLLPQTSKTPPRQSFCLQTNISVCDISQNKHQFTVTVFSAQAQSVSRYMRVPVNSRSATVMAPDGKTTVQSQIVPSFISSTQLGYVRNPAPYVLIFPASLQPMGFTTYFINTKSTHETSLPQKHVCTTSHKQKLRHYREVRNNMEVISVRYAYEPHSDSCVALYIPAAKYNYAKRAVLKGVHLFTKQRTCHAHCKQHDRETYDAEDLDINLGNHLLKDSIKNKRIQLNFDTTTGLLREVVDLKTGKTQALAQNFFFYKGAIQNKQGKQASGAYIFRPNGTEYEINQIEVTTQKITGPLVNEMRQIFSPWLSQSVRIYKDKPFIEFEWTVGPIPYKDNISREVIVRYDSSIKSAGVFQTDANGRQLMQRVRNHQDTYNFNDTEKISRNYYPVNSRIALSDSETQMNVFTDRSQGGASLFDGSLELMIHRRDLHDDHFGVGEALNETGVDGRGLVVRGRHWLMFTDAQTTGITERSFAQEVFHQPILAFSPLTMSPVKYKKSYNTQYSGLKKPLPDQVNILTMEQWQGRSKLIRLEHIMQKHDSKAAAVNVTINNLFTAFDIVGVEEMTLGANQLLNEVSKLSWTPESSLDRFSYLLLNRFRMVDNGIYYGDDGEITVSLNPMQIRTFKCAVTVI